MAEGLSVLEVEMKKWKATTLLSIVSVILAFLVVMTFARFPIGIKNFNSVLGAIETDYDISGGNAFTYTLAKDNEQAIEDIDSVIETLEYRLDSLGYKTYSVKAIKPAGEELADYSIRIEAKADSRNGSTALNTLSTDIATVMTYGEIELFGGDAASPTTQILEDVNVIDSAKYDGVYVDADNQAYYQVAIRFTDEAYEYIEEQMDAGAFYLKVQLSGSETVLLDGSTALSADYFNNQTIAINATSEAGAKQIALQLSSGGLAYKFELDDTTAGVTVTSPYGENTERNVVIAISILCLAVIAVMFVTNKGFGVIYALCMIAFIIVDLLMMIAVPGIKISMGGVIGIALSVLLTADGFIITTKRMNEEFASGKTFKAALKTGFKRAFVPIINISLISGITGLLIFIFANGSLQSFGITLGIGAVVSFVTTVLFTRMFASLITPLVKNKEVFFNVNKGVE